MNGGLLVNVRLEEVTHPTDSDRSLYVFGERRRGAFDVQHAYPHQLNDQDDLLRLNRFAREILEGKFDRSYHLSQCKNAISMNQMLYHLPLWLYTCNN